MADDRTQPILSNIDARSFLGKRALFFNIVAGYLKNQPDIEIPLTPESKENISEFLKGAEVQLTLLRNHLDKDSASFEQEREDKENTTDAYIEKGVTNKNDNVASNDDIFDDVEITSKSIESNVSSESGDILRASEIRSFKNATVKLVRDLSESKDILEKAVSADSISSNDMLRAYSLFTSIRNNSYVTKDAIGYDFLNPEYVNPKRPRKAEEANFAYSNSFSALQKEWAESISGRDKASLLAVQGLQLTLGPDFYNDMTSSDILDMGRVNNRGNQINNIIRRTDSNALEDGNAYSRLMIANSAVLEMSAMKQYEEVCRIYGQEEGNRMIGNIETLFLQCADKVDRFVHTEQSELKDLRTSMETHAIEAGMIPGCDFISGRLNIDNVNNFFIREDVLEKNLKLETPETAEKISDYNRKYLRFTEMRGNLFELSSLLARPLTTEKNPVLNSLDETSRTAINYYISENSRVLRTPGFGDDFFEAKNAFTDSVNTMIRFTGIVENPIEPRTKKESLLEKDAADRFLNAKGMRDKSLSVMREYVDSLLKEKDPVAKAAEDIRFFVNPGTKEAKEILEKSYELAKKGNQPIPTKLKMDFNKYINDEIIQELAENYIDWAKNFSDTVKAYETAAYDLIQSGEELNRKFSHESAVAQADYLGIAVEMSDSERDAVITRIERNNRIEGISKLIERDDALSRTLAEQADDNADIKKKGNAPKSIMYGSGVISDPNDAARIMMQHFPMKEMIRLGAKARKLAIVIDHRDQSELKDEEISNARINIAADAKKYTKWLLKYKAEPKVSLLEGEISTLNELHNEYKSFSGKKQAEYGHTIQRLFDKYEKNTATDQEINDLYGTIDLLARNNPGEKGNAKILNEYLISGISEKHGPTVLGEELVKAGIAGQGKKYSYEEDIKPILATLPVAGEKGKKALADYHETGKGTYIERKPSASDEEKKKMEDRLIFTRNEEFSKNILADIRREAEQKGKALFELKNLVKDITSDRDSFALALLASSMIADGPSYSMEKSELLRSDVSAFNSRSERLEVFSSAVSSEMNELKAVEIKYDEISKADNEERVEKLREFISEGHEGSIPIKALADARGGLENITSADIEKMKPSAGSVQAEVPVLPHENLDLGAFQTFGQRNDRKELTGEDKIIYERMTEAARKSDIYTYAVNAGTYNFTDEGITYRGKLPATEYAKELADENRVSRNSREKAGLILAVKNIPTSIKEEDLKGKLDNAFIEKGAEPVIVRDLEYRRDGRTANTVLTVPEESFSELRKIHEKMYTDSVEQFIGKHGSCTVYETSKTNKGLTHNLRGFDADMDEAKMRTEIREIMKENKAPYIISKSMEIGTYSYEETNPKTKEHEKKTGFTVSIDNYPFDKLRENAMTSLADAVSATRFHTGYVNGRRGSVTLSIEKDERSASKVSNAINASFAEIKKKGSSKKMSQELG